MHVRRIAVGSEEEQRILIRLIHKAYLGERTCNTFCTVTSEYTI